MTRLLPALVAALLAGCSAPPDIDVVDAWVSAGTGSAAAYMTLENQGGADRLVTIAAPGTGAVSLHESSMDGGVMRMRALPTGIAVGDHGVVKLAPRGLHAMIMIKRPLHPGDTVALVLRFARQGEVRVAAPVRAPGDAMPAMPGMAH